MEKTQKNTNKKRIIIISCIVLAVILTSVFLYKTLNKKEESPILDEPVVAHEALDFINDSSLATIEEYEYWQASVFPIDAYNGIRENYKRAIVKIFMDNKYTTSGEYFLTKIENRAKNIFAFGNFTGRIQKERQDLALLVEKSDYQGSGLFIISHEGHLLYWKEYENELPIISSFTKGSKIFMNKMELESSPLDGIIIKFKARKEVLLYDSKIKTFETFYQYTKDDIMSANEEETPYEEEVDSTRVSL
ncbi:hypothetical protein [Chryseobacterium sp. NKUCC03_KSP]|uniref:hypothetical protein n=1 Tax=Chryseobacterium sp. NKUCC03_KSP TaxID=2842125 RepID=UPI001C5A8708|nr:hypothetical protein [Chryseobacterium sp. NKUCC03_KSP]MBW3521800.1 hypothetical protein [Chryseobacterium sp. NKUCC03_KSP]